jgi:hypothetical protein
MEEHVPDPDITSAIPGDAVAIRLQGRHGQIMLQRIVTPQVRCVAIQAWQDTESTSERSDSSS